MLDPQRVKLDAANIGFLVRTGQNVDMDKVKMFLQTDDSGCAKVRREADTPVNELHVMGGQRFGLEGNMNLQDYTRQQRQINGYPLRSFSANAPAVILPPKYGGFPQYVQNEGERDNFVSRFTEPISAPLQQNTILLGREGYTVDNHSASDPFQPLGFEMNMDKSKEAIDANEYQHAIKRYLERVENRRVANMVSGGKAARKAMPYGGYRGNSGMTGMGGIGGDERIDQITTSQKALKSGFKGRSSAPRIGINDGIFIGSDGKIMTQVASVTNNAFMTQNVLNSNYGARQQRHMNHDPLDQNDSAMRHLPSNRALEGPVDGEILEDAQALEVITSTVGARNQEIIVNNVYRGSASTMNGSQAGNLVTPYRSGRNRSEPPINYRSPEGRSPANLFQIRQGRNLFDTATPKPRKRNVKSDLVSTVNIVEGGRNRRPVIR
jgi:hypothetical protein